MESFGFLYIATGDKYIYEAHSSALSLKKNNKNNSITIFTDKPQNIDNSLFDNIKEVSSPTYSFYDKVNNLGKTPYYNTVFLDTDTYIVNDISDLVNMFNKFDIAIAHAPIRTIVNQNIPLFFPEFNTGVILYKNKESIDKLFKSWKNYYSTIYSPDFVKYHDQPSFRKALYESDINFYVLPPEYNLRTVMPFFIGGMSKVFVLHGRNKINNKLISKYNEVQKNPKVMKPYEPCLAKIKKSIKKLI